MIFLGGGAVTVLSSWSFQYLLQIRALASLTVPGGQGFHFPHFPSNSINFSYFSSSFTYFLPHFGPPGGRLAHPGRPWLRHCMLRIKTKILFNDNKNKTYGGSVWSCQPCGRIFGWMWDPRGETPSRRRSNWCNCSRPRVGLHCVIATWSHGAHGEHCFTSSYAIMLSWVRCRIVSFFHHSMAMHHAFRSRTMNRIDTILHLDGVAFLYTFWPGGISIAQSLYIT